MYTHVIQCKAHLVALPASRAVGTEATLDILRGMGFDAEMASSLPQTAQATRRNDGTPATTDSVKQRRVAARALSAKDRGSVRDDFGRCL